MLIPFGEISTTRPQSARLTARQLTPVDTLSLPSIAPRSWDIKSSAWHCIVNSTDTNLGLGNLKVRDWNESWKWSSTLAATSHELPRHPHTARSAAVNFSAVSCRHDSHNCKDVPQGITKFRWPRKLDHLPGDCPTGSMRDSHFTCYVIYIYIYMHTHHITSHHIKSHNIT